MDDGASPNLGIILCILGFVFILFVLVVFLLIRLLRAKGITLRGDSIDVTEEEIISMVNEGHEQGVLLASEAEMIHNIFEFGDKDARDIMTHRKNIVAVDGSMTFLELLAFIRDNHYSRFPVYNEDINNIIGVLHIREALILCQNTEVYGQKVQEINGLVHEAEFIPETRNINTLFTMMQTTKNHMVIVVDEYGQTAGLVAMEDILEEIVGNIEDEHDDEERKIVPCPDGAYLIDGMADFSKVRKALAIDAKEDEAGDFETLNGFLISKIDKIPGDDEVFSVQAYDYLFEILSVENKIIQSVRVKKNTNIEDDGGQRDDGKRNHMERAV